MVIQKRLSLILGFLLSQNLLMVESVLAKNMAALRTDTPPVIDGILDEAIWSKATPVDDFHQIKPGNGDSPSEKTVVKMLYDEDFLYFSGTIYEENPADISANVLQHNAGFPNDDRVTLIIDPFNAGRNGYRFETNALGARHDMLYTDSESYNSDWNTIWDVASKITEDGWSFEMAIPFKSLSFDPAQDSWGVNFSRAIRRKDEEVLWVSRNRSYGPNIVGTVSGIKDINQGIGLDVVPSFSLSQNENFSSNESEVSFEPSLDMYYRLTPSLNASLTFNTDFSATEVDDRQVNLTRFGLFFPEKRDFFLNDADQFTFGGIQSGNNVNHQGATAQNGRPFFSRSIGLGVNGEPVDIDVGAKLSGRVGSWSIGTLAVRQTEQPTVDAADLFVSRIKRDVLSESSIGVIVTSGDPNSNLSNTLIGTDFLYTNSRLLGGKAMEAQLWYQQTDTEGLKGDDRAMGAGLSFPNNEGLRGAVQFREIQENFNPALGFVNRRGVRDYDADIGYKLFLAGTGLGQQFQSAYFGVDAERIYYIDGDLQSAATTVRALELATNTKGSFSLRLKRSEENVNNPFVVYRGKHNNIVIQPGEYTFDTATLKLGTGGFREVYGSVEYTGGEFYDGDRNRIVTNMTWQPSPRFSMSGKYDWDKITLPQGDFITRLAVMEVDYTFALGLTWKNLIQYDTVSEVMGVNSRLSWNPKTGQEAFFVLNHTLEDRDRDNRFESASTDAVIKMGYTFRY